MEAETLERRIMFIESFFLGDGTSGVYKNSTIKYC